MVQEATSLESVLNLAEAMSNMDGDHELLQEVTEIFLETSGQLLDSIAAGIAAGNVAKVATEAHGMKGGASNICAGQFVASALALELLAKGGSLDGADRLLARMSEDLAEVCEVARAINWEEVARNWKG